MTIIHVKNSGAKICLPIEINTKIIFVMTISLFIKIVFYFVFPDHIRPLFSEITSVLSIKIYFILLLLSNYLNL